MPKKPTAETHEFKAEIQKLLHIITHSMYTNREIFVRELISNASDALDKLRFGQSRGDTVADPELNLEIRLAVDADNGVMIISDTGVGMTREELVNNIGTIARSGSEEFLAKLAESNGEAKKSADDADKNGAPAGGDASAIIGRFGVGFYSVFMAADKVVVRTRSCQPDAKPLAWTSDGLGSYTIEELGDESTRGTTVEIHLREDAREYLDPDRVRGIIKTHSNFISFPIFLNDEQVNTIPALWREPKFSIKQEQYNEFYSYLTMDHDEPLATMHLSVDAPVQFQALMFVPKRTYDIFGAQRDKYGLNLYARRVLIQSECKDLIPEYLGFLKGVVDTEDLPLNISRETLQENVVLRKIASTLTKQALTQLARMADEKAEDYEAFWRAHGTTFKLGHTDYANREKVAALLRFNSSHHEDAKGLTSLADCKARMKEGQKGLYFISGTSRESIKLNPHLEIFRKKGLEVLYLLEPIDEFVMDAMAMFDETPLISVENADLDGLDEFEDAADAKAKNEAAPELEEADEQALAGLMERIKAILNAGDAERVTEVRESKRLSDSPCCLVSPDGRVTSSMEKMMRVISKDTSLPQKAMEINRDHPLVRNLLRVYKADAEDAYLTDTVEQLYDSLMLMEGYLTDPHRMVERISSLLESSSGWYAEIKKV